MSVVEITEASVPKLPRHVKFRFDEARGNWVLLAPERVLVPDEIAADVLRRVDGARTLASILDDLSREYEAPRDVVAADVTALLQELAGKGMITA